ncbi:MAG TPA: RNA 2',3'-cyclic phosphodiesterase [Pyrinomonadaceae bacterium]|nr:RNA 2',3'-cyclic phosphodiesterase [Pyrinomonadaceae bacterium]
MTLTESWRVFCAVELPAEVRTRLQDHVRQLRADVQDVAASWTRVENIHLTLKFFGNVERKRIASISAAALRATEQFSPFTIDVGGTGVFPKPSRAQVLWIGINDPSDQLAALQKQLENQFAGAGFEKEGRAFKPHLTIARIRRPEGARQLADAHLQTAFQPQQIGITEIVIFRSELSPQGSKYTALSRHKF